LRSQGIERLRHRYTIARKRKKRKGEEGKKKRREIGVRMERLLALNKSLLVRFAVGN